jgi:hypothetical protein
MNDDFPEGGLKIEFRTLREIRGNGNRMDITVFERTGRIFLTVGDEVGHVCLEMPNLFIAENAFENLMTSKSFKIDHDREGE